uniref:hypothetical protein n=1 Tax=uncultured Sphingomonas sp. TaxID=158754 RepID=UPI002606B841
MIIQAMPDAVIAPPTCHGSRPSTRAMGPASATNDIIAIEQTKVSNISGFMLKAPDPRGRELLIEIEHEILGP